MLCVPSTSYLSVSIAFAFPVHLFDVFDEVLKIRDDELLRESTRNDSYVLRDYAVTENKLFGTNQTSSPPPELREIKLVRVHAETVSVPPLHLLEVVHHFFEPGIALAEAGAPQGGEKAPHVQGSLLLVLE